jgi:hypothetical protein
MASMRLQLTGIRAMGRYYGSSHAVRIKHSGPSDTSPQVCICSSLVAAQANRLSAQHMSRIFPGSRLLQQESEGVSYSR